MRFQRRRHPCRSILILGLGIALLVPLGASAAKEPGAKEQLEFGVQMARRGLWSEALFRFKKADELQPNEPKTLNNLAVAYEAIGQFEEALEHYQKALRASPSNRDLKKNYARFIEFYQGFKPEGEEDSEGASSQEDDDGSAGRA